MKKRLPASAPYGQACKNCFKSKCKCIQRAGNKCERCHRLRKECVPSETIRVRPEVTGKDDASAKKVAQLESRLDSLLSCLENKQSRPTPIDVSNAEDCLEAAVGNQHQVQQNGLLLLTPTAAIGSGSNDYDHASTWASVAASTMSNASSALPPAELEVYMSIFRETLSPSLPFIRILPSMTVPELYERRPLLTRAIVAVVAPTVTQKQAYGDEFKQLLAQAMIVQGRSSIDLLQGLLVYVAWSFDHFINKTASLLRYIQLAMAIVSELGLNQAGTLAATQGFPFTRTSINMDKAGSLSWLELERTVLSCFVLSATISAYSGQTDVMRWTPLMEEYAARLKNANEDPHDELLLAQVRLQLCSQDLRDTRARSSIESASHGELLYLASIRKQLHGLVALLAHDLQHHHIVRLHALYLDLLICEVAYPSTSRLHVTSQPVGNSGNLPPGFRLLECQDCALTTIKSYFEIFTTLPVSVVRGLAFPTWTQALRCVVILYQWSTQSQLAWENHLVRSKVDLVTILGDLVKVVKQTGIQAGETSAGDLFGSLAAILHAWQKRVDEAFARGESEASNTSPKLAVDNTSLQDATEIDAIELGSDLWLGNIFGWP